MSGDDWEKRKLPRAVAGSGLEKWTSIGRILTAREKEARARLEKLVGSPEVAAWILYRVNDPEPDPRGAVVKLSAAPPGLDPWWRQQPAKTQVLAGNLRDYMRDHVRIQRSLSDGKLENLAHTHLASVAERIRGIVQPSQNLCAIRHNGRYEVTKEL